MDRRQDPLLSRLVERLDEDWRKAQFRLSALPRVAASALADLQFYKRFDGMEMLRKLASGGWADTVAVRPHPSFAVFPLFNGARFSINLHCWQNNLGEPHSHAWAGAYQVLSGTCVTASFDFQESRAIDPRLRVGTLRTRDLILQKPGATAEVHLGRGDIHGQSYADLPGLSISVRSAEPWPELTYSYWAPGLAVETTFVDESAARQLKGLDALYVIDPDACAQALHDALRLADVRTTFFLLQHAQDQFAARMDVEALIKRAAATLRSYAEVILGALASVHRKKLLESLRAAVSGWDHRFLLSLLFLAPDYAAMRRLVRLQYGRRDADRFLRDVVRDAASQPSERDRSALGTPLDPDLPAILALMIEDERPAAVLKGLAREYERKDIRSKEPVLRQTIAMLRQLPQLQPLFVRRSAPP